MSTFYLDDNNITKESFDEAFRTLSYKERLNVKDVMERFLFRKVNEICPEKFRMVKEENKNIDIGGVDGNTEKVVIEYGRKLKSQIKKRHPGKGDDLLIEVVSVWPPPNVMTEMHLKNLMTGRDMKFTSDMTILIDSKWNVYFFPTPEVKARTISMFMDFILYYRSNPSVTKLEFEEKGKKVGEIKIWNDGSDDGDWKGRGYLKCGAFIVPATLTTLFKGKIS